MPVISPEDEKLVEARLNESLNLLRQYSPQRYKRVSKRLSGFIVAGNDTYRASYHPNSRLCGLRENFVLDAQTTAAAIATTITHEATHGWLFDLGIGYEEAIRYRVELACIRAALLVARRLPDATAEIERCGSQLSIEPEYFSTSSFAERAMARLRELGCPEWVVRSLVWFARKSAA